MELFKAEGLTFQYADSSVENAFMEQKAISNLSFDVKEGEFLLICGKSGCGKTTLLRNLKPQLTPFGNRSGQLLYKGVPIEQVRESETAFEIGYVMQKPENQIVTDKVWHELAFGLENAGMSQSQMHLRVAELASFFGLQELYYKDTNILSGGQKQILNLASIMAMQPKVLILDEPTSQLDPIAASEFIKTVQKIHDELGTTIIMSEHSSEHIFSMADRVMLLDEGNLSFILERDLAAKQLMLQKKEWFLPASATLFARDMEDYENHILPLNVKNGREYLKYIIENKDNIENKDDKENKDNKENKHIQMAVEKKDGAYSKKGTCFNKEKTNMLQIDKIWFSYERKADEVLKGVSLSLNAGEIYALLGGNGCGKTTLLHVIAGLYKPFAGKIRLQKEKNVGMLCQDPQCLFSQESVLKELGSLNEQSEFYINCMKLEHLLERHPYDLSGGEQQRVAFAKVMMQEPDIILLDEPTKGLDGEFKEILADVLLTLKRKGKAILLVSHDIEFCARYADRCGLLFQGEIVSQLDTHTFFQNNYFYTTIAKRISQGILSDVVTKDDLQKVLFNES